MANKNRILYLLEYLRQNSDENHPVSTAEIREAMAAKGCPVVIPTLRDDIESLREAGYEIQINEQEGLSTTYSWLDREWSHPELQILVDAVASSQFITVEKSRELIEKLVNMASPSFRDSLIPQILVSEHVKAPNQQILLNVQAIRKAMEQDRKITFNYLTYTVKKKQVHSHAGTPEEKYRVSPYATIWNNDRYYMVGYSDKRQKVNTFRIDRMKNVRSYTSCRVPVPEDFNTQDYVDKVFWMYDGREVTVTLRCKNHLMDQVIDKFGPDVNVTRENRDTFDITVPVHISGTFYAWVLQFVGEMTVIGPESIRSTFADYLQQALDDVLGEDL